MAKRRNVISLTAHRNTRDRRARKQLRRQMVTAARNMASAEPLKGYVIIGFDRSMNCYADWDTGKVVPLWHLPNMVRDVMLTEAQNHMHTTDDDFEPEAS